MYRNVYRSFTSSRRAFLRQSAALAGITAASPAFLSALTSGRARAADGASYADELWAKTKEALAGGDFRKDLNIHAWEGYTEEPVLDPFSQQTGASVNAQMLISDPAAVNNLRSGGTGTWDVINLNNSWARKQLYPEGLILPLEKAKFEPLYAMNNKGFEWPYHWAMDASRRPAPRHGPALRTLGHGGQRDLLSPETLESGGYMEMIEGAAGEYGILDYEDWVIMHTCLATGFSPFRKHTPDEMAAYEEMIFKVFQNAKKISDDQATLARDMITGEIVGTFFGSVYTVSAARNEGETQIVERRAARGARGDQGRRTSGRQVRGHLDGDHLAGRQSEPDAACRGLPDLLPHARGRLHRRGEIARHAQPGGPDGGPGGARPVQRRGARGDPVGRGRQLAQRAVRALPRFRRHPRLRRDARPLHSGQAQPRRLRIDPGGRGAYGPPAATLTT